MVMGFALGVGFTLLAVLAMVMFAGHDDDDQERDNIAEAGARAVVEDDAA